MHHLVSCTGRVSKFKWYYDTLFTKGMSELNGRTELSDSQINSTKLIVENGRFRINMQ